jgi:hypothetical protein
MRWLEGTLLPGIYNITMAIVLTGRALAEADDRHLESLMNMSSASGDQSREAGYR